MVPVKMVTGAVLHREIHIVIGSFPSSLEQIRSKQFQEHFFKKAVDTYYPIFCKTTMRIQNHQYVPFFLLSQPFKKLSSDKVNIISLKRFR